MRLMEDAQRTELVWQAQGASIGQINAELERLRGRAMRQIGIGRWPEVRTRVANLVVYGGAGGAAERALETVDDLPGAHPSRAVFVRPMHDHEQDGLDVRLDLRDCSQSGDLVAMERVWLEVHGSATRHLSSVAIPLLLADLPVFLWWPGPAPHQHHQLSDMADRLIVDSSQFVHASDLAAMGRMVRSLGTRCAVSDFNWLRLYAWREMLAQLFDYPDLLPHLRRLQNVSIGWATESGLDLTGGLLLAGWLASALGWTIAQRNLSDNGHSFAFQGDGRRVEVEVVGAGTASVELHAEGGAVFHVRGQAGGLRAEAILAGEKRLEHESPLPERGAPQLLFEQLRQFEHDTTYEAALHSAETMLEPRKYQQPTRGSLLA